MGNRKIAAEYAYRYSCPTGSPPRSGAARFGPNAPDEPAFLSVALEAKSDNGVVVAISRYRGSDSVPVTVGDADPVPFEDLAVAKGVLRLGVAARARPRRLRRRSALTV